MSKKTFDLRTLRTNPRNPQHTTPERMERLKESLRDLPKMMRLRPLVYDPDTMTVLGGNKRLDALLALDYTTVPAEWVASADDLTPEERRRFIIADNVGFGTWDADILQEDYTPDELEAWGLEPDAWSDTEEQEAPAATDDGYAPPPDLRTDVAPGDLITIGPHRLLCGDSTNADDVAKVMDGEKADMVFTDPPYGVDYSGGIQFTDEGVKKEQRSRLENDHNERIYEDFLPLIPTITSGPVYTWFAGTKAEGIYRIISKIGEIHALLIWVKNGGYGALNACYKQKHEPCLFWKPKGGKLNFVGDSTECTIWEIKKDGINEFHPTQKPVALAARAIGNHSGDIVADPFLGSGTTMVAAHQLNRRCFGIEIDPHYCQVIIDRMHKLDPDLPITINGKPYTPGG